MEKHSAEHKKKMVAPVIITVLFWVYLAVYAVMIVASAGLKPVLILAAVPLAALGIGMIYTLRERIKEIRSGEEDDLGNY